MAKKNMRRVVRKARAVKAVAARFQQRQRRRGGNTLSMVINKRANAEAGAYYGKQKTRTLKKRLTRAWAVYRSSR